MAEKDKIFGSKIKHGGLFDFPTFYKFLYDWLMDETGMDWVQETKYVEKLKGDSKDIDVEWEGQKKLTDFFRFDIKINFRILGMKKVEMIKDGKKIKTNDGSIEIKIAGTLTRDYQGKFETTAFKKFLRGIYEKWVIKTRMDQLEGKVFGDCQEFLEQAKAYLDLEGKQ